MPVVETGEAQLEKLGQSVWRGKVGLGVFCSVPEGKSEWEFAAGLLITCLTHW